MMRIASLPIIFFLYIGQAWAVDPNLRPNPDSADSVSDVYRDMIVVQRKAKVKADKMLLQVFETVDFSDGPEQYSTTNLGLGYAFSDHFELYLNVAPLIEQTNRPIKDAVSHLNLANGTQASLDTPKPKFQYGLEAYWLPAYGKDSWGPHHIIRSDTFIKFAVENTQYDSGTGLSGTIGIGKTFFLGRFLNPRITGSFGVRQETLNGQKANTEFGLFELGDVFYF